MAATWRRSVQRDLVERAQQGDRESFGILVDGSTTRLYNVAQLMLGDGDLAQDAVQEALIQTWRDLRGLRDADRFDSWLHRILVRCVYRVAGRERRQVERRQPLQSAGSTAPDPGHRL